MSTPNHHPTWKYDFKINNPDTWLPTFGKWCGKGWSAGQRMRDGVLTKIQKLEPAVQVNHRESPVDAWCKDHDLQISAAYKSPRRHLDILKADLRLHSKVSSFHAKDLTPSESAYARLMRGAFTFKILLFNLPIVALDALARASKRAYTYLSENIGRSSTPSVQIVDMPQISRVSGMPAVPPFSATYKPQNLPEPMRLPVSASPTLRLSRISSVPVPSVAPSNVSEVKMKPVVKPLEIAPLAPVVIDRLPLLAPIQMASPAPSRAGAQGSGAATVAGSPHSLVQAMAGFRPPAAAQTRWPGATGWGNGHLHQRAALMARPQ